MKLNTKTLKAKGESLNQTDISDFEKQLRKHKKMLEKTRDLNPMVKNELVWLLKEVLGDSQ